MNIFKENYETLKKYFNNLNNDQNHYKNSNDICTPIECIEEMISTIPENFWKNRVKILDPCCGNGNFTFVVYHKLRQYHSDETFFKEILYFNEINETRINNLKNIFYNENFEINITSIYKRICNALQDKYVLKIICF